MTKTIAITLAIAGFAALSAAAPTQAATRMVDFSMSAFADRCADQGGQFVDANPHFGCKTADAEVICSLVAPTQADCQWPGIDNQIAVNRLIGMAEAESISTLGTGAKKGGIKLPDLPIKW